MASIFTITLVNHSGSDNEYAFFMDSPEFQRKDESWMTVWFKASVPHSGAYQYLGGLDTYAYSGTVPVPPKPGVIVSSGMSLVARLGTDDFPGSTFKYELERDFPLLRETKSEAPRDTFEIITGHDIPEPNEKFVLGLSKVNDRGQVAPVGVMTPRLNQKVAINPGLRFYIAVTDKKAGEIVDREEILPEAAVIDFSKGDGRGKTYANVTHISRGWWDVKYPGF